jgi:biotin transporter BioY
MNGEAINRNWLSAVAGALNQLQGWGVCISNISGGYLIIFPLILLVTGKIFENCRNVDDIIRECGRSLVTWETK